MRKKNCFLKFGILIIAIGLSLNTSSQIAYLSVTINSGGAVGTTVNWSVDGVNWYASGTVIPLEAGNYNLFLNFDPDRAYSEVYVSPGATTPVIINLASRNYWYYNPYYWYHDPYYGWRWYGRTRALAYRGGHYSPHNIGHQVYGHQNYGTARSYIEHRQAYNGGRQFSYHNNSRGGGHQSGYHGGSHGRR